METLQRTANRGSVSTGYDIDNSLKLEDANFEHITKNYSGDGDMRTWTYSTWVKKCKFGSANFDYMYMFAGQNTSIHFLNNGILRVALYNGSSTVYADIDRLFRDGSAWYHIIVVLDTTQSTAADRVKIYINGVRETVFDNSTYTGMSQNEEFTIGQASANYQVGYFYAGGGSNYGFSGYMAETHYVNGTALDETSFGEFDDDSGIWKPKEYTGSHGSKGFYLKFDDSSNLGKDSASSGIGDFTVSNITAADQATDTPTNNFCTWNTIPYYNTNYSFANGATEVVRASGTGWTTAYSSIGANKGKWYAEFQVLTSGNYLMNGNVPLAKIQSVYATQFYLGSDASAGAGAGYYSSGTTGNDAIYHDAGFTSSGVTTSAGDIISVAMDCDNNKIHFAVNGTYTNSSNPATNTNGFNMTDDYQFFAHSTLTGDQVFKNNFGGFTTISISSAASDANGYGTFEYAPPSGFYALNTKNLAEYG